MAEGSERGSPGATHMAIAAAVPDRPRTSADGWVNESHGNLDRSIGSHATSLVWLPCSPEVDHLGRKHVRFKVGVRAGPIMWCAPSRPSRGPPAVTCRGSHLSLGGEARDGGRTMIGNKVVLAGLPDRAIFILFSFEIVLKSISKL
jgi:hypothetical protein